VSLGDYSSKEVGVIVSLSHASSSKCRKGELAFLVFNFFGAIIWCILFCLDFDIFVCRSCGMEGRKRARSRSIATPTGLR